MDFKTLLIPKRFYQTSSRILPWLGLSCAILLAIGLFSGLYLAPADYQQGDGFRIIYIHVPSAFLSLLVYVIMATCAAINYIWKIKIFDIAAYANSIAGISFTILALISGSIWGKPMWGTWWIWDARLTSELILLFMYLGYWILRKVIPELNLAGRASAILAIVGLINIPIIHYSVYWWNTLHQQSTLLKFAPSIDAAMLYPLLMMLVCFGIFYLIILILQMRNEILRREIQDQVWL